VGISADSRWSHKAFSEQQGLDFPLLSDWFGEVGKLFDVWSVENQREQRTVFVIDTNGKIAYVRGYPDNEVPDLRPAIQAIQELRKRDERIAS